MYRTAYEKMKELKKKEKEKEKEEGIIRDAEKDSKMLIEALSGFKEYKNSDLIEEYLKIRKI